MGGFGVYWQLWGSAGRGILRAGGAGFADGRFHHVVGVRSAERLTLYLDGVPQSAATFLGDVDVPNSGQRIAHFYGQPLGILHWNGRLDEIAIYRRALDQAEVDEHLNNIDCADIPGAIAETYQTGAEDLGKQLRVRVTANNAAGSATAVAAVTAWITAALPVNTSPPEISGIPKVGETLSATTGAWSGNVSAHTHQWQRCDETMTACIDILGASAAAYTVIPPDAVKKLRVRVTATNPFGEAVAVSEPTVRVFAIYTYAEARAYGVPVPPTPEEIGLPECIPDIEYQGLASVDSAPLSAAEAGSPPTCMVDPRGGSFLIGGPQFHPHPGPASSHHHMGVSTSEVAYRGGISEFEVGDPDVDHAPGTACSDYHSEFAGARVMATNSTGAPSRFIEAGWVEHSCDRDTQPLVYTFKIDKRQAFDEAKYNPAGYPLRVGRYYMFRVVDCVDAVCVDIRWSGEWRRLDSNGDFRCTANSACEIENFVETYGQYDSTPHPDLNAGVDGVGVNARKGMVARGDGTWVTWDMVGVASSPRQEHPYCTEIEDQWERYRVYKTSASECPAL